MSMRDSALPGTMNRKRIFTATVDNRLFERACAPEQPVSTCNP